MRYETILKEIDRIKPSSILEVGTWSGVNAVKRIKVAQKYNSVTYYGFDLWEDFSPELAKNEFCPKAPAKKKDAETRIAKTGCKYFLFQGNTLTTLKDFYLPVDFIFIDGGHSVKTIESDWNNLQKNIHKSTVIIFDDYYWETTKVGCKLIIDNLHPSYWIKTFLEPTDMTNNGFTNQLVRVERI